MTSSCQSCSYHRRCVQEPWETKQSNDYCSFQDKWLKNKTSLQLSGALLAARENLCPRHLDNDKVIKRESVRRKKKRTKPELFQKTKQKHGSQTTSGPLALLHGTLNHFMDRLMDPFSSCLTETTHKKIFISPSVRTS